MDAAGISWAALQPCHGYLRPDGIKDTMRVNDRMATYRRQVLLLNGEQSYMM